MYVCMYVCVYMFMYIYVRYVLMHIFMYMYMWMDVCMHAFVKTIFKISSFLCSPSSYRVESYFFHSFKQAITLIHGSTKYFNDMPIEKQKQLWAAATLGSDE